jgi:hypothetical protein
MMSYIQTQPHRPDILMRANAQSIGMQKRCLRQRPGARQLKTILPVPKLPERCGKYGYFAENLAVCIANLLIIRFGVSSFMDTFHSEAQKVIEQYHIRQMGHDIAYKLFPIIDTFPK